MKKAILTLVAAIAVIIGMKAYPVNKDNRGFVEVNSFEKINVSAPLKIRVIQADTFSVNVMVRDSFLFESIKYDVNDGTLNIYSDDAIGDSEPKIRVIITTPNKNLPNVIPGEGYYIAKTCINKK